MGLFKLRKNDQDSSGGSGNVDDWLKTIDQDAENAATSSREAGGLAPIAGIDPPTEPVSVAPTPSLREGQHPPDPGLAADQTQSDIGDAGWHLPDLEPVAVPTMTPAHPNSSASGAVPTSNTAPTSTTLPDLGFSNQPVPLSPQEPLPPAWAQAIEADTPPPAPFEAEAPHPAPFEAETPQPAPFEAEAPHPAPFEAVRPATAPPLETAPPLDPAPIIESSSIDIIPSETSHNADLFIDYDVSDLGVVLDGPNDNQPHPFEAIGLAGTARGRITETTGTIKLPEDESVATLLAILGLDRDVSWDEVKHSHGALITDHQAAGESDPERSELARSIRREINSAYIALRLLQVP